MKAKFLMISCGMLVLASACNNGADPKDQQLIRQKSRQIQRLPWQKTQFRQQPAPPPVDSAAITREYLAARKTAKKPALNQKNKVQTSGNVQRTTDAYS